jgi:hypothetical protein
MPLSLRLSHPVSRLLVALGVLSGTLSLRCGSDELSPAGQSSDGGNAGETSGEGPGGAPGGTSCEPGDTRECIGPAACRGGQACSKDGSGWGACDCGDEPGNGGDQGGAGGAGAEGESGGRPIGGSSNVGSGGGGGGGTAVTCSPSPQSGCKAREKCVLFAEAAGSLKFTCVPDGDKAEGEACASRGDGTDDCAKGLFCNGIATTPRCQPYCNVEDAAACDTECTELNVSHAGVSLPSGYGVCQPTCDLLEQDCAEGDACIFFLSPFPVCAKAGENAPGDDCASYDDCEAGSACLLKNPDKMATMCTPLCEGTQPGSCEAAGETCVTLPMLYQSVPDNMLTLGFCYPCSALPGVDCELLAPDGCTEEADCAPLLEQMGFPFSCSTPTGQCVLAVQ